MPTRFCRIAWAGTPWDFAMSCGVSPAMMMSTLPPTRAWVASGPLANSTGFTELTPAGFSHSCSLPLSKA